MVLVVSGCGVYSTRSSKMYSPFLTAQTKHCNTINVIKCETFKLKLFLRQADRHEKIRIKIHSTDTMHSKCQFFCVGVEIQDESSNMDVICYLSYISVLIKH